MKEELTAIRSYLNSLSHHLANAYVELQDTGGYFPSRNNIIIEKMITQARNSNNIYYSVKLLHSDINSLKLLSDKILNHQAIEW